MIFDILLIVCVLLFVIVGMIRGGIKTLCSLIATVLAFIISIFGAAAIASDLYGEYISPRIVTAVSEKVISDSSQVLQNISDVFPDYLNSVIESNGIDINAIANGAASQSAEAAAQAVEKAVAPYITSLLTVTLLIILFILLRIIFSLIINLIDKVFRLPVLKQLNRLLGFVCGFIQGIVVALLIAAVIQTSVSSGTAQPQEILNEVYINSSYLFKYFYSGRLLEKITELMS